MVLTGQRAKLSLIFSFAKEMYALLCKPIAVPIHNKLQITAKDCRIIKIMPSKCDENSFEIQNAPPITISTKNYYMKKTFKKTSY